MALLASLAGSPIAAERTLPAAAAASTYERLLRENPKNLQACVAFGLLEEHRGNWQHAEELYRRYPEVGAMRDKYPAAPAPTEAA